MTFLNPLVLIGLAAAALPVVLHLLNLRRLRTIEFSTLAFLKELQKTRIRRLKLRQLLLLILRTLLVIFIVLAFARPTVEGSLPGAAGEQAKTTSVIILDDSYSMTAHDEQGEFLNLAKAAAEAVIDLMREGDDAAVVRLSSVLPVVPAELPATLRNPAALRAEIQGTRPSFIHRSTEDALRLAASLLERSKNFNREVYLISDFQAGGFERFGDPDASVRFPPGTRLFCIPTGRKHPDNIALQNVSVSSTLLEAGQPFTVRVGIINRSDRGVQDHVVSVFLNGTRVTQQAVDLRPRSHVETEIPVIAQGTGFIRGVVEIEDDALEFDNRRYVSVRIPGTIRLTAVGSADRLRFVRLALATRRHAGAPVVQVREIRPAQFGATSLGNTDALVIADAGELTRSHADRIRAFVESGGGLVLFSGSAMEDATFNETVGTPLGLPHLSAAESFGEVDGGFTEFDKVDLRHPLFHGVYEQSMPGTPSRPLAGERSVESPRILRAVRFAPTTTFNAVITMTNGAPFLLEGHIGTGRVILFATSPTLEWGDFPLKGIFVPLMHRSVGFAAMGQEPNRSWTAGEEVVLPIRGTVGGSISVVNPEQLATVTRTVDLFGSRSLRWGQTEIPGLYAVHAGTALVEQFAVNPHPDESVTDPVDDAVRDKVFERLGIDPARVTVVDEPSAVVPAITQSRFGTELWKYMVLAAALFALAEMAVGRAPRTSQERPVS